MIVDKVMELIGEGKLQEAIEKAINSIEFKQRLNDLYVIRGNYAQNEIDNNKGILERSKYEVNRSKITQSLVKIVEEVESNSADGLGAPRFFNEGKRKFVLYGSIFSGENTFQRRATRVESISWSTNGEFFLTHCLDKNHFKIWSTPHKKDATIDSVIVLKGVGPLRKVYFHKYDDSIWAIEDNSRIVIWEKARSEENQFGVIWERKRTIEVPEQIFRNPFIKDVLYGVNVQGKSSTYVLVQENKEAKKARLLRWVYNFHSDDSSINCFERVDHRLYFNPKLKYLNYIYGKVVVLEGGHFPEAVVKGNDKPDKLINSHDIDDGESRVCDIFVASNPSFGYSSVTLYNAETKEPEPILFKYNWTRYWDVFDIGSPLLLKIYKGYPYKSVKVIVAHELAPRLSMLEFLIQKDDKIHDIHKIDLKGHKKRITRIDTMGAAITTASEDGTIRLWYPEAVKNREIACIGNCHPILNPFEWDPVSRDKLAYADKDGYVYILKLRKDPYRKEKIKANFLVKAYEASSITLTLYLAIYFLSFCYFFYASDPDTGFVNKLFQSLAMPTIKIINLLELQVEGEDLIYSVLLPFVALWVIKKQAYNRLREEFPYHFRKATGRTR